MINTISKGDALVTSHSSVAGPVVSELNDDDQVWFLGAQTWIRSTAAETGGVLGLVEHILPPGFASPYHVHRDEDEAMYVIEGTMRFVSGEESWLAGPGGFAFLPRDIPHGFQVEGNAPARVLLFATPAGFTEFVSELSEPAPPAGPPDLGRVIQVAANYNVEILGPLPGQAT